ncbi:MAG: murein biosynthesis integral membrane protein MurJ [Planctomycetota bacterium]
MPHVTTGPLAGTSPGRYALQVVPEGRSVAANARLIGAITFGSRVLGLARESIAASAFGAGPVWSAFTIAFTIPNLFRKLFGEGALSAAFIPIYARLHATPGRERAAQRFAAQGTNLLVATLAVITVAVEIVLISLILSGIGRDDHRLAMGLTAIMLPYVVFVCGAAFLGGFLNVHGRFAAPAAASVLLNLCLIAAIGGCAVFFDLSLEIERIRATYAVGGAVVVSGVLQVLLLWPSLKASGYRFLPTTGAWSRRTRQMVRIGLPVAFSAAVLQIGVLLDKGIAFFLAAEPEAVPGGWTPMAAGAAARLNWAQYVYQFPLGVFAIALATAVFPALARDAKFDAGRNDSFRQTLRRGIESAVFLGIPASLGLVLVATDAVRVLFERGRFTTEDTQLVATSVAVYSAAVWAFALQQIVNRAYYALQETTVPLRWAMYNLAINVAIELPLIWLLPRGWGEVGMPVGTFASFAIQSLWMMLLLNHRLGGIGLGQSIRPVAIMLLATGAMVAACWPIRWIGDDSTAWSALRLGVTMVTGAGVYFAITAATGVLRLPRRGK